VLLKIHSAIVPEESNKVIVSVKTIGGELQQNPSNHLNKKVNKKL